MGIYARNRQHGQTSRYSANVATYRTTYRFTDGSVRSETTGTQSVLVHHCHRSSKQRTPPPSLQPNGFREPTSYSFGAAEIEHTSGNVRNDPGGRVDSTLTRDYIVSNALSNLHLTHEGETAWISNGGYHDPNSLSQAEVGALLKLGGAKAEIGTMLGESIETANHLASTASDLAKLLLHAKHGRWSSIPRLFKTRPRELFTGKTSASRLLELKYGWMPLMNDIKDIHDLLREGIRQPLLMYGKRTIPLTHDIGSNNHNLGTGYLAQGSMTRSSRVALWAYLKDPNLQRAQQLGLVNPAQIGWELVPFSFVVDWFIPVGSTLAALTATTGLEFAGGSKTCRTDLDVTFQKKLSATESGASPKARYAGFSVLRNKYGTFPRPTFYAKRSPFTTDKVLTALALIRQLF